MKDYLVRGLVNKALKKRKLKITETEIEQIK